MWIEKRNNGNYKFTERYTDVYTGKQKKVSITLEKNNAQTRKMAEKLLQEKIDEIMGESNQIIRLSDLCRDYIEFQKITVKASTYTRNTYACAALQDILGSDLIIENITAKYVTTRLLHSGKTPRALNELLTRFKALVRWGYRHDYISDISFVDKLEPFKDETRKEKIKDKFLELAEVQSLLENMTLIKWRLLTSFLVFSGLRVGEALALTKDDVNIKDRIIHVNKNYDVNNRVVTTTKTLCSIRDVYMQNELLLIVKEINVIRTQLQLLGELQRNDLFFPGSDSKYVRYDTYRHYLARCSLKSIGRKITPHYLRHTHASLLMENGVPIEVISRRLGHENSKITKEIYLHVTEKLKEKDNEQIAKVSFF